MMTERPSARNKPLKAHLMDMMSLLVKNKKVRAPIAMRKYNDALDRDVMSLIKRVEKEESALLDMPYTLFEPTMLHGFMGLKSYLLNLFYENTFIAEYENEEVEWIYKAYCKKHSLNEEEAAFNFYKVVYLNALFCDYLKKDYGTLRITKKDCELAQGLLGILTDGERDEILFSCARKFTFGSLAYNNKAYMRFSTAILSAIKKKDLASLLVVEN